MALEAGKLRHRVDIQTLTVTQDSNGAISETWVTRYASVPADIGPVSAREFMAADAMQSEITGKIRLRWRDDYNGAMRIVHNGRIYNPAGVLPDNVSGREYVTIPVKEGVNAG